MLVPMHKIVLGLLITTSIFSCSQKNNKDVGAWIGGQIINPLSDYVLFTKDGVLIDSLTLDENNKFLFRIDTLKEGLYNFIHEEYQILYLEPGDSLMIRVNTVEFDESIGYTGIGSARNRFLIDMFLYNEKESQLLPQFYMLSPQEFTAKADSMRSIRVELMDNLYKKEKLSTGFKELAQANIDYNYFLKLELYPYAHFGRNNITLANLPDDYYDFRENIDYNSENLQGFYTYYSFLVRHFDHLAYEKYCKQTTYDPESSTHIYHKLEEIHKLVQLESLKNRLLNTAITRFVTTAKYLEKENQAVSLFYKYSTDESCNARIHELVDASLKMLPGNTVPDITLENIDGTAINIKSVLKKPTVLYFWSVIHVEHHKNIHSKADELKQKYPEFDFIAININDDAQEWKRVISRNNFDKQDEFRFQQPRKSINDLVVNILNKVIVLDSNGVILENNTSFFQPNFEEELLGILNK